MRPQTALQKLQVKEIFYSIQGEGYNVGKETIFVRLAGCNLSCTFCDTNFKGGKQITLSEMVRKLSKHDNKYLIWTGGEPAMQLTDDVVQYFNYYGYKQGVETNGTIPLPLGLDYVTVSPKGRNVKPQPNINEVRLLVNEKINYPLVEYAVKLPAERYFVSPMFCVNSNSVNKKSLENCLKIMSEDRTWKLSLQIHKLLEIR